MNKQELIKKIKEMPVFATTISKIALVRQHEVIKLIEQLNQAKEVKLPQVAIDYIKHAKDNDWDLQDVFGSIEHYENGELSEWLYKEGNMDFLARYWLDGYKDEDEKKYLVKLKLIRGESCYLNCVGNSKNWIIGGAEEYAHITTHHTRKELEDAGFGEVFDNPLSEVGEVD